MFPRPLVDSPRVRPTPIDITSSPPSPPPGTKRQKTSHTPVAKKQSQTPGKKGVKGKKIKEPETGNKSILSFFKPVSQSQGGGEGARGLKDGNDVGNGGANGERRERERDHHNDELFISHGGYELDVSEPEEEEGVVDVLEWRKRGGAEEGERPKTAEAAEIARGREVTNEGTAGEPLAFKMPPARAVEDLVPHTETQEEIPVEAKPPEPTESPKSDAPKFVPGALKLDLSSSMLFGKINSKVLELGARPEEKKAEGPEESTPPSAQRPELTPEEPICTAEEPVSTGGEPVSNPVETPEFTQITPTKTVGFTQTTPKKEERVAYTQGVEDVEFTQISPQKLLTKREDQEQYTDTSEQVFRDDGVEDFSDDGATQFDEFEHALFDPASKASECFYEETEGPPLVEFDDIEDFTQATQRKEDNPACPICSTVLSMSDADANRHVNSCLDGGRPPPQPIIKPPPTRPSNPLAVAPPQSAFQMLMSSTCESAAWDSAAKRASADHNKRAAARKCPFYKILFNGPIAVDAFRYGKIPGVASYFLSHFHSDHYVGLSSKWAHGPIFCSRATANLVRTKLNVAPEWVHELKFEEWTEIPNVPHVRVLGIDANHCPGSMMFLFEALRPPVTRILHCGDFRAEKKHLLHPILSKIKLDAVYLDTTYLDPKYSFPAQHLVISACASISRTLSTASSLTAQKTLFPRTPSKVKQKLLVLVGTYSIGKERICLGIAEALGTKIWCPAYKAALLSHLEDPHLNGFLTTDPAEAQVHLTSLNNITSDALATYLASSPGFTHILGFRPSGWSYRAKGKMPGRPRIRDVLYAPEWNPGFGVGEMKMLRGSTERVAAYAVPYSEHSSFRELGCFCVGLNVGKVVPTVNVGKPDARREMEGWIEKWRVERGRKRFSVDDWERKESEGELKGGVHGELKMEEDDSLEF